MNLDMLALVILIVFYVIVVIPIVGSFTTSTSLLYSEAFSIGLMIHISLAAFFLCIFAVLWAAERLFG